MNGFPNTKKKRTPEIKKQGHTELKSAMKKNCLLRKKRNRTPQAKWRWVVACLFCCKIWVWTLKWLSSRSPPFKELASARVLGDGCCLSLTKEKIKKKRKTLSSLLVLRRRKRETTCDYLCLTFMLFYYGKCPFCSFFNTHGPPKLPVYLNYQNTPLPLNSPKSPPSQ